MRLDQIAGEGNKYALLNMRLVREMAKKGPQSQLRWALQFLRDLRLLNVGIEPEEQFFAIKLKDKNAAAALEAYSNAAAANGDAELSVDVRRLAEIARNYPTPQMPT